MKDLRLTSSNMSDVIQELQKLDLNQPKRIKITEWKGKRSLTSNGQIHLWFDEIAKHKGDETALEVKNFCKDAFGLPLLLNSVEHGDKMEFLLHKLDYYKHSHESKMKLIQCLEVTSLLNTSEIKLFMDHMKFYYNDIGIMIKHKGR